MVGITEKKKLMSPHFDGLFIEEEKKNIEHEQVFYEQSMNIDHE